MAGIDRLPLPLVGRRSILGSGYISAAVILELPAAELIDNLIEEYEEVLGNSMAALSVVLAGGSAAAHAVVVVDDCTAAHAVVVVDGFTAAHTVVVVGGSTAIVATVDSVRVTLSPVAELDCGCRT